MSDDLLLDYPLPIFFGLFILALIVLVLGASCEGIQESRSFDARVACEAKRMEPRRRAFTTHVVCIPVNTRQDTTTINVR